jgi:hypothetical protein
VNLNHWERKINLGFWNPTEPIPAGWEEHQHTDLYDAAVGYGWVTATNVDSRERDTTNLDDYRLRTFVFMSDPSTENDFRIDVPGPGYYKVQVTVGDSNFPQNGCRVLLNNDGVLIPIAPGGVDGFVTLATAEFFTNSIVVRVSLPYILLQAGGASNLGAIGSATTAWDSVEIWRR